MYTAQMARSSKYTPAALRALRKKLKMTQAEIAARVRVSTRTWTGYESDRDSRSPSRRVRLIIDMLRDGKI